MRKTHLALAAVGLSAAAVTGSAFTAANTVPASVAGYGQGAVTGATVTNIHYVANSVDSAILDAVEFTTTTNVTSRTSTMTLRTISPAAVVGSPYNCTVKTVWDTTSMVLTCNTSGTTRRFADFDAVGLTVAQ